MSDIVSVSVVRVMLVSVNLDQINKEKVPHQKLTESNKLDLSLCQLHHYLSRVPDLCMWEDSL